MSSHWITECPHCGTSFRVTEQHLRAAKGSVRCGSCLQIFNAINTLFPDDATLSNNITSTPNTTARTQPEPTAFEQPAEVPTQTEATHTPLAQPTSSVSVVEAFISGDVAYDKPDSRHQWEDEQVEYADDEPIENFLTPTPEQTTPHRWGDDEEDYATSELSTPEIDTPDLDAPFIDTPELDEPFLDAIPPQSPWRYDDDDRVNNLGGDPFAEQFEEEETDLPKTQEHEQAHTDPVDDPYHQLAAILESSPAAAPAPIPSPATQPLHADDVLLTAESRIPNHEELESDFVEQVDDIADKWVAPIEAHEPHIGPYREPFRDALLSELEAEPPSGFQWGDEYHTSSRTWLWGGVSFLLVMALAVQYVMFNYNDFAETLQKPPFDGWMRTLCENVSCRFVKTDLSLVANENLLIRAHPSKSGFLVLDTMLYNRAPFEQPFPLLDLSFADMQNNVIARRIFKPEEYLSGDLEGLTYMPMNTPLHISFAIKNPSELATNYELKLISNTR